MHIVNYVVYTCRLHVDDMFDEMPVMDSRVLVMILFILLLLHHCFLASLLILSDHSILGSDLGYGPETVPQILGTLRQNW